jgi:general stress protein CsbA
MTDSDSTNKFRVITVHGVNSKGEWQEEVATALSVFFDFEPIKYNDYRWFFGTELVLNPFVWLPFGALLIVGILIGSVHRGYAISLWIVAILVLSLLAAYPYRVRAVKKFREKLSQKFKKGGPFPCLIAHSFGTYLTGRALHDLSWSGYDRVVLAGCVLDGDFPWPKLQEKNPPRFREVRNEMAARDNISRLAAWLDRLIPGFGSAGYSGFQGTPQWVHTVNSANSICIPCETSKSRIPIHNIKCEELGHSDVFLGPAYAVIYWLPFLWGYDPASYRDFMSVCFEIKAATSSGRKQDMKAHYQKLRTLSWGQTPRKSLDQEIQDAVPEAHNPLTKEELDKIATETLRFVLLGQAAFDDEHAADRNKYVQCLNVYLAIDAAWKKAYPTWQG